jgi:hypothetical protein
MKAGGIGRAISDPIVPHAEKKESPYRKPDVCDAAKKAQRSGRGGFAADAG